MSSSQHRRELLREEHALWRIQGTVPHASYEGQWDQLCEVDYLPDAVLDSMIDRLLFDVDEEGGPRCSCVDCFFKPARQLRASYRTPQGRPVIEDAMRIEGEIGFTMKQGHTLKSLLEEEMSRS